MEADSSTGTSVAILTHLPADILYLTATVCAVGFALLFFLSWNVMKAKWPAFAGLSPPVQADCVARVGSTAHAIILVPCLIYYLASVSFNEVYEPRPDVYGNGNPYRVLQLAFAFSQGYFFTDAILTVYFRMPMWPVFLLHHVMAAIPYFIFLWGPGRCRIGTYILASFLIVESCNVSLNNQVLLERNGNSDTVLYATQLYTTLTLWISTRLYIPMKMVYLIHTVIWPALPDDKKSCLYFSVVCAWFIVVFCGYAFLFVLLPEVKMRWQSSPEPRQVAHLDDSRVLKIDPHVPISADALAVATNSPMHTALYRARVFGHDVEAAVDKCIHPHPAGAMPLRGGNATSNSNNNNNSAIGMVSAESSGSGAGLDSLTPREMSGTGSGVVINAPDSPINVNKKSARTESTDSFGHISSASRRRK